jgi:hypothetical protein
MNDPIQSAIALITREVDQSPIEQRILDGVY